MNKKKTILSILMVAAFFVVAIRFQQKKNSLPTTEIQKQPTKVNVTSAADSKLLLQKNQYPATVVGDQEVKITAKAAGTITAAPGSIGSSVSVGALLAKIDDTGTLSVGSDGLKSLQVQQAELAAQQAKKSYSAAKDNYANLKKSSSSTKTQIDSARSQRDIAKLQYENALLGLNGNVDNHLMTSPISGIIINKTVSVGDSVSVGQLIATVSKSSAVKVQFFVDQEQRSKLTNGQEILATDASGNLITLNIRNIAIAADQSTKRFLVEAYPKKQNTIQLLGGTVVTVSVDISSKPQTNAGIFLPLSAVSVGQNENYIFVVENNIAKKIPVDIAAVDGEVAEISTPLAPETLIITEGSKLVSDGETINIQK